MTRMRLFALFILANLAGATIQGCLGTRPAHASPQANVGDNIVVPLNRIADAVERIARHMER